MSSFPNAFAIKGIENISIFLRIFVTILETGMIWVIIINYKVISIKSNLAHLLEYKILTLCVECYMCWIVQQKIVHHRGFLNSNHYGRK